MASATARQLFTNSDTFCCSKKPISAHHPTSETLSVRSNPTNGNNHCHNRASKLCLLPSGGRNPSAVVRSSAGSGGGISSEDEGVSLGTMKLPANTDIPRFETLLFQWANSLCQGAQLPLPMPLKVDKIGGGVRLGFVEIDDGKTDVSVYINCIVIPGNNGSDPPVFQATRNGPLRNKVPPGEPRIMKSLLAALQKSVEIARV